MFFSFCLNTYLLNVAIGFVPDSITAAAVAEDFEVVCITIVHSLFQLLMIIRCKSVVLNPAPVCIATPACKSLLMSLYPTHHDWVWLVFVLYRR
jgi:hypothetical protein